MIRAPDIAEETAEGKESEAKKFKTDEERMRRKRGKKIDWR